MIRFARGYPGCLQRCNTKDGLRIDLKVAKGYVYFNMSRVYGCPTQAEYRQVLAGAGVVGESPSIRLEIGPRH